MTSCMEKYVLEAETETDSRMRRNGRKTRHSLAQKTGSTELVSVRYEAALGVAKGRYNLLYGAIWRR